MERQMNPDISRKWVPKRGWFQTRTEDAESFHDARSSRTHAIKIAAILLTLLLGFSVVALWRLVLRADGICQDRAENNVTLCRGEMYAVNVIGDIECGCRGAQ